MIVRLRENTRGVWFGIGLFSKVEAQIWTINRRVQAISAISVANKAPEDFSGSSTFSVGASQGMTNGKALMTKEAPMPNVPITSHFTRKRRVDNGFGHWEIALLFGVGCFVIGHLIDAIH